MKFNVTEKSEAGKNSFSAAGTIGNISYLWILRYLIAAKDCRLQLRCVSARSCITHTHTEWRNPVDRHCAMQTDRFNPPVNRNSLPTKCSLCQYFNSADSAQTNWSCQLATNHKPPQKVLAPSGHCQRFLRGRGEGESGGGGRESVWQ